ncbi:ribosome biogenesis GTPase Era [Sutterella parvirubra YIT 11816]|uniref:GTPase Era n=2 Tax=Sutterella TaxID=40544 RepID=H3KIB0_9BURK|nr:ribosome biogenesis GTPase Era [Sutterella parvirubra YIT 11816]
MTKEELQTEVETEEVLTAEDGAEGVVLREDDAFEAMLKNAMSTAPSVPEGFRCGYVAVVGRPNVGKSTLINRLIGEKVSITSKKPQTTRDRVLGVVTEEDAQYVFVDTPGFQTKVGSQLIRRMNRQVRSTLNEVDAIVLVIESGGWRPADLEVVNLLPKDAKNVILALNKTDLLKGRDKLLPLMAESMQKFPFAAIVPVSAEKGRQCDELLKEIKAFLPESVPFFDPDTYTDRSPRFLAAETIREKAFRLLGDELPYGCAVTIDRWKEEDEAAEIIATLIVERESHKPIVIGEGGAKLREISRLARTDIAAMLGKRLHLEVWVRVRRGWSDDARALKSLGYD